jgi:uncharacterized membrane protein YkoI
MQKKLRLIITLLLAAVITAAAPLTAFAQPAGAQAQTGESSMEAALVAAKELLKIDDAVFTDFSYSSTYSNYETREGLAWSFSWSDSKNAYINALVMENGAVMHYWKYDYTINSFGFAQISKDAAVSIANDFIKRAAKDTFSYYKAPENVYVSINNGEYRMTYYAEVNGYTFDAARISISVNKFTGEVTGYDTTGVNPGNYKFEGAGGVISESDAVAAYAEKIGLSLEYRSYFNYEDGSVKVFPVYLLNSGGDRYISAKTGEIVSYEYDAGSSGANYGSADMAAPAASASLGGSSGGGGVSLSPAEIAAIEKASSYMSSDQALKKLLEAADIADLDVGAFNSVDISLSRDYANKERYFYYVNIYRFYADFDTKDDDIMGLSGRLDAETGKIYNFSINYFGFPQAEGAALTEAQIDSAADAFLKKIAPQEYAKTKKDEPAGGDVSPYRFYGDRYINYTRYENGIAFRDNRISVSINQSTGKIMYFYLNWYDNVSFPSVGNVLTPQRALSAYAAQNGTAINYITTGNGNASLVYLFTGGGYVDPFTGKALDYNGEMWVDSTLKPDYSDVAGHWSESTVKQLFDNGVYGWSGKFDPNKVMTELEFLQYLMLIEPYYYYVDSVTFLAQRGIGITADPNKTLTRQEAARIIVEYLGYQKLAEQSKWFIYPFTDNVAEEYKGYITICYMLGIVGGDNGKFNAGSSITRAQAAVILKNLITVKS